MDFVDDGAMAVECRENKEYAEKDDDSSDCVAKRIICHLLLFIRFYLKIF